MSARGQVVRIVVTVDVAHATQSSKFSEEGSLVKCRGCLWEAG